MNNTALRVATSRTGGKRPVRKSRSRWVEIVTLGYIYIYIGYSFWWLFKI